MTIDRIKTLLDADVLCGTNGLSREVEYAFSSDMMSDVLAYADDHSLLITGLCNPQVIRTSDMLDIICVIFINRKTPTPEILTLAEEKKITVLCTSHSMFSACGILYSNGLPGGV